MSFKVGDTFKFRKGLVVGHKYGGLTYSRGMEKDTCIIASISPRGMYKLMNNWFVSKELSIPIINQMEV